MFSDSTNLSFGSLSSDNIHLTWDDLFVFPHPLFYEVSVGSVNGSADILQWQETTDPNLTLNLDTDRTIAKELFVTVRGITPSGIYETVSKYLVIPPST